MTDLILQDLDGIFKPHVPGTNGIHCDQNNTYTSCKDNHMINSQQSLAEKTAAYFTQSFNECGVSGGADDFRTCVTPWHSALAQQNVDFVKDVLQLLTPPVRTWVVNCRVDYMKPGVLHGDVMAAKLQHFPTRHIEVIQAHYLTATMVDHPFKDIEYSLPLSIAATSNHFEMMEILLSHSCDLFLNDDNGNNIIHHLALLSLNHCDIAVNIYQNLIGWISTIADKQRLIRAENHQGNEPLDVAMSHMSVEFAILLLNTENVYKFPVKDCGIFQHILYDVSQYELRTLNKFHIFHYLATVVEKDLGKLKDSDFMNKEPVKSWITAKVESHQRQTIAWGLTWVVLLILYFSSVGYYVIATGQRPPMILSIAVLIDATLLLCNEISNLYMEREIYRVISHNSFKGLPIAFSPAYRVFHLLFSLSLTLTEIFHLSNIDCNDNTALFVTLYVLNAIFGLSSLLLFTQLNKHTGHLLIIIDRMMWDVVLFISVAGIIFFAFALAFYLLHAPPMCNDPNNTLTWDSNRTMFTSFMATIYETQLLALGIMAPKSLYFEEAQIPGLAMALYVVFLIMLCIVLINLLIAIMSDRVSQLSNHKHTIMQIQALSLALFLEGRMKIVEKYICHKFNPSYSSKWQTQNQYFIFGNDKVYLHVLEKIPHMNYCNGKDLTSISTIANMKIAVHRKVNKKTNNVNPV